MPTGAASPLRRSAVRHCQPVGWQRGCCRRQGGVRRALGAITALGGAGRRTPAVSRDRCSHCARASGRALNSARLCGGGRPSTARRRPEALRERPGLYLDLSFAPISADGPPHRRWLCPAVPRPAPSRVHAAGVLVVRTAVRVRRRRRLTWRRSTLSYHGLVLVVLSTRTMLPMIRAEQKMACRIPNALAVFLATTLNAPTTPMTPHFIITVLIDTPLFLFLLVQVLVLVRWRFAPRC